MKTLPNPVIRSVARQSMKRLLVIFGLLMIFAISGWGACTGTDRGAWNSGTPYSRTFTSDFYSLTFASAGTLNLNIQNTSSSFFGARNITYTLYQSNACNAPIVSGTTLTKGETSTPSVSVSAGTYTLQLARTTTSTSSYSWRGTFAATLPPSIANQSFSVAENSTSGTPVGTIATTGGTPTSFTKNAGGTGDALFNISNTGVITVAAGAVLNYETATSYTLKATAANAGGTSAEATITINITDIAGPTITSSQTFSIGVNAANGATVGTVATTGGTPTSFSIGNPTFAISSLGVITVANKTDLVVGANTVSVTASNGEGSSTKVVTINVTITPSGAYDPFSLRKQLYVKGNMKTIGNTVLVAPTTQNSTICNTYTNGAFTVDASNRNDEYYLCDYKIDTTTAGLTNSTKSELDITTTAKVLWAGLYWQALVANGTTLTTPVKIRRDESGSSYTDVSPKEVHYDVDSYVTGYTSYSAFADVTSTFTSNGWGKGNYTVANVPAVEGKIANLGTYGAWTLVIVYEDPTNDAEKFRSFSIFDGWQQVKSGAPATIPVSGFYTPNRTMIDSESTVSVFTAEGDKNIDGDQLKTKNYNTNADVVLPSGSSNTFTSLVTGGAARTPNATNNQGIDIQTFNIGNLLTPKQTNMSFTFTSSQDVYWPSMIAVATVLLEPQMCYDYSLKQDGRFLTIDRSNSYPVINQAISGSNLDLTIYLRNKEADINIDGLSVKADLNASNFTYTSGTVIQTSNLNGSVLIPRGAPVNNPPCAYNQSSGNAIGDLGCTGVVDDPTKPDDILRVRKGNGTLGSEEFVFTQMTLKPTNGSFSGINESLGLSADYYMTAGGTQIPIPNYILGSSNVPLCPSSADYVPAFGYFNVVERGTAVGTNIKNNIKAKISRKSFDMDVAFDSTPTTADNAVPTGDLNTTVLVDMIDADAFGDTNTSCRNPDANVTGQIFVPLTITNLDNTDPIETQPISFYNFAVKNGAWRVWYFTDKDNNLIKDWTATTTTNSTVVTGINNKLYVPASHAEYCSTACSTATSVSCFDCMKKNYGKTVCSRDNFSVRPEAFDIRIKDGTTTDLSTASGYAPNVAPVAGKRLNLSAGYDYNYDITATGHEADATGFVAVPRYTRYFDKNNPTAWADYNITMVWDSDKNVSCNDKNDTNLSFYIVNGSKLDQQEHLDQVGNYKLSMIDREWTKVDQVTTVGTYRTNANKFDVTKTDCIPGDNRSVADASSRFGCEVSSGHINTPLVYKDQNLSFRPYKFDISTLTMGLGMSYAGADLINSAIAPAAAPANAQRWTYISDLNLSDKMGVRYSGNIAAQGKNNKQLSNFVDKCFAQPLDLNSSIVFPASYTTLNNAGAATPITTHFDYRLNVTTDTNTTDMNNTASVAAAPVGALTHKYLTLPTTAFLKDQNGSTNINLTVNFDRNHTVPINPIVTRFNDFQIKCQTAGNCSSYAEGGSNNLPDRTLNTAADVTFAYNRFVTTNSVTVFGSQSFALNGYYEVYNIPSFGGTSLAPSLFGGAPWYQNPAHVDTAVGDANITYLNNVPSNLQAPSVAGVETYNFAGQTPPYNVRAHFNIEPWSWYRPDGKVFANPGFIDPYGMVADTTVTDEDCYNHPCARINVVPVTGASGSAKLGNESAKHSKGSSSTGAWRSSSDYAPAIR